MMNNEQIVETLKESGMRITRQRMIVADVIADNDGASCKDICCIVRGKVYQTLRFVRWSGML